MITEKNGAAQSVGGKCGQATKTILCTCSDQDDHIQKNNKNKHFSEQKER